MAEPLPVKTEFREVKAPVLKKKYSAIKAHERAKCYALLTSAQDGDEWSGVPRE